MNGHRAIEVRIHGVGGSAGEAMLGVPPSPTSTRSTTGPGTVLWRRNDDTGVEAYDWGSVSSSSPIQALWILLLPFTLVNVASRLGPRPAAGKSAPRPVHSFLVHAVGVAVTFTSTAWLSVIFVDLIGLQWFRRVGANNVPFGWSREDSAIRFGWAGMWLGVLLVVATLFGLRKIASKKSSNPLTPEEQSDTRNGLANSKFFDTEDPYPLVLIHLVVVIGCLFHVVNWFRTLDDTTVLRWHYDLGGLVLAGWSMQALSVGALFIYGLIRGRGHPIKRLALSAASACALACVLTNSFFASLSFLLVKQLNRYENSSDTVPSIYFSSYEHSLTDVWIQSLGVSLVLIVILVLFIRRRANSIPLPESASDPWWAGGVRNAAQTGQKMAAVGHTAPYLVAVVGIVTIVWGVIAAIARVQPDGWNPSNARLELGPASWRTIASTVLPVVLGALILYVRKAAFSSPTRRAIGTIWDVLTFWPRTHHPLAVRSSAAQIVPELRARLADPSAADATFVVAAHSQGSILAVAALESAPDSVAARVRLVTYGSPIETLYHKMFPTYFNTDQVDRLYGRLSVDAPEMKWRNFYRLTDPIGGPVIAGNAATTETINECLPDPAIGDLNVEPTRLTSFEPVRQTWDGVAGHSHYLAEAAVQRWIHRARDVGPDDDSTGSNVTS